MYKYFSPIPETCEQLKSMYRKLAQIHHTDCYGTLEAMQAVNSEYETLFAKRTIFAS